MFGRSTAYSCQKNGYVQFPHFMTKKLQQNLFKSVGTNGFCRKTAPQKLVLLICQLRLYYGWFGWQLHYMLTKISLKFEG